MPLNILQESPHDLQPPAADRALPEPRVERWVPSRYTVRATTEDGGLLLWNSLSGAMNVFGGDRAGRVKALLQRTGMDAAPSGLAKYLFDRGYLMRDGTNEYRIIQQAFGQEHYRSDALELILLTSEDCNLRCRYCYEDFARGTMLPWVREAIKKLVAKRISHLQYLSISYFGGEPLYGWQAVEDLAPFFLAQTTEHGIPLRCVMTTNGYLLTPEVADKLLAWKIDHYQITLDGPPEHHDCSRPARDGSGTFSTIIANLRYLHSLDVKFRIDLRVNFDNQNKEGIPRLLDQIAHDFEGDPRFQMRFRAVGQWGGPNDEQLDVCGASGGDVKKDLEAAARQRGLHNAGGLTEINHVGAEVCYAARPYNYIVGAHGKLMKCTIALDKEDYNVVGAIKEDGELTIDKDRFALWTEPAFEGDRKCQKCVVLPLCQGMHCPMVRIEENRSPCTPNRLNLKSELVAAYERRRSSASRVRVAEEDEVGAQARA
jgi:uncharacterized protein